MLSEEQCAELHQRLRDERQRLDDEIAHLRVGVSGETFQTDESDAYDQHPADAGSELFEREKNLSVIQTLEVTLGAVDEALAKFDAGTYGQCARCGKPIADKRLLAMPEAVHCIECEGLIERDAHGRVRR